MNLLRPRRLRSSHSYGAVLALIVISLVFIVSAPGTTWYPSALTFIETIILIAALWTSGLSTHKVIFAGLALLGLAVVLLQLVVDDDTLNGAMGVLNAVLLAAACCAVGLGVSDQQEINPQSILGAISIYLAIGILFAFAYDAAATVQPGNFFAQGTDGSYAVRLYFSFVTLATLGYGDYTPAADAGRMLAVSEAIVGQLYLVTVLAILVGNVGRRNG